MRDGSLIITRDILIRCAQKNACWGALSWAFGEGPPTVKELAVIENYFHWCVNNYVLPRQHREELYLLTGYSRMRGRRWCHSGGYLDGVKWQAWPAGHVRTVADMYLTKKAGTR